MKNETLEENQAEPEYSTVFENLVESESDIRGLIAYALYKQNKRQCILDFIKKHSRNPSNEELNILIIGQTKHDFERFQNQADSILFEYASTYLESERKRISQEANRKSILRKISSLFQKHLYFSGFWWQVSASMTGTFAIAILLFICYLIDVKWNWFDGLFQMLFSSSEKI